MVCAVQLPGGGRLSLQGKQRLLNTEFGCTHQQDVEGAPSSSCDRNVLDNINRITYSEPKMSNNSLVLNECVGAPRLTQYFEWVS